MFLVPAFIALMLRFRATADQNFYLASLAVFAIAAVTDALDGFIARTRKMKTELGSFLDPLADKFLISSATIILCLRLPLPQTLPSWYGVLVISRDVLILTGVSVIYMMTGDITIKPSIASKITTFLQIVTVLWVMLAFRRPEIIWHASAAFTVISAVGYILEGGRKINAASEANPGGQPQGPGNG